MKRIIPLVLLCCLSAPCLAFDMGAQSVSLTRLLLHPNVKNCLNNWQELGPPTIGRIEKTLLGSQAERYMISGLLYDANKHIIGRAELNIRAEYGKSLAPLSAKNIQCQVKTTYH